MDQSPFHSMTILPAITLLAAFRLSVMPLFHREGCHKVGIRDEISTWKDLQINTSIPSHFARECGSNLHIAVL
jgi:hypothetical protein